MKIISITGLDGSGKTTQAKRLAAVLPQSRMVSVWDLITRAEFKDWSIYCKSPKVEQYVMHLSPLSRSLFIFHAFNEAYEKAMSSTSEYLIFDGYWYKYWAIEQAMGAPKSLGSIWDAQYLKPDFNVFLDLSPEEILKRKKEYSVYETANKLDQIKTFYQIQSSARKILHQLMPETTIKINALNSEENIHQEICRQLHVL